MICFLFHYLKNNYYNNYTSHAGIVAELAMSEQLHGKHTGVLDHIWITTMPDVEIQNGPDVSDIESSMQPLLMFNHLFTQSVPLGIPS